MTAKVFDLAASRAARDEAIDRVERHANPEWKALLLALVIEVAKELLYFTADDVFLKYHALDNPPVTHENRAFGAVMQKAKKLGVCRITDRPTIPSKRRNCHAKPLRQWQSLVFWDWD